MSRAVSFNSVAGGLNTFAGALKPACQVQWRWPGDRIGRILFRRVKPPCHHCFNFWRVTLLRANSRALCLVLATSGLIATWPRTLMAQTILSPSQAFAKIEAMVPMRDGVRLNTEIYVPHQISEPLPIVFTRTPYGIGHDAKGFPPALGTSFRELARDGYIFVWQDIRGRFKSEGKFVMLRTPRDRRDPKAIDESTDTYDTIDWLLKQVPNNNGRVGILGIPVEDSVVTIPDGHALFAK